MHWPRLLVCDRRRRRSKAAVTFRRPSPARILYAPFRTRAFGFAGGRLEASGARGPVTWRAEGRTAWGNARAGGICSGTSGQNVVAPVARGGRETQRSACAFQPSWSLASICSWGLRAGSARHRRWRAGDLPGGEPDRLLFDKPWQRAGRTGRKPAIVHHGGEAVENVIRRMGSFEAALGTGRGRIRIEDGSCLRSGRTFRTESGLGGGRRHDSFGRAAHRSRGCHGEGRSGSVGESRAAQVPHGVRELLGFCATRSCRRQAAVAHGRKRSIRPAASARGDAARPSAGRHNLVAPPDPVHAPEPAGSRRRAGQITEDADDQRRGVKGRSDGWPEVGHSRPRRSARRKVPVSRLFPAHGGQRVRHRPAAAFATAIRRFLGNRRRGSVDRGSEYDAERGFLELLR